MTERDKEGLITDDGEIRECPSNKAKMGYVRSFIKWYGYKRSLQAYDIEEIIDALIDMFSLLVSYLAYTVLLPILPFLQCWYDVYSSKKEVTEEANHKRGKENG